MKPRRERTERRVSLRSRARFETVPGRSLLFIFTCVAVLPKYTSPISCKNLVVTTGPPPHCCVARFFFWRGKQFIRRKTTYLQLPMCWVAVDELSAPPTRCASRLSQQVSTQGDHLTTDGPDRRSPRHSFDCQWPMACSRQRVNASTRQPFFYCSTGSLVSRHTIQLVN